MTRVIYARHATPTQLKMITIINIDDFLMINPESINTPNAISILEMPSSAKKLIVAFKRFFMIETFRNKKAGTEAAGKSPVNGCFLSSHFHFINVFVVYLTR